jgi:hypothetical protein
MLGSMSVTTGMTEHARLELLERHRAAVRAQLDEGQSHLAFIDRKIATYKDRING